LDKIRRTGWRAKFLVDFYQVVKMLRMTVMSRAVRELLVNGSLPVPVVSAIAFRQGARVAGTSSSAAAAAAATTTTVNTGRHRTGVPSRA